MAGDHKCPVCQATFTRPQHVARHMRSHTGDRPYKCQHCGDQFARSDLLSRHVNKCHAGDKPPTTTAPNRRKGQQSSTRATTSKQACDQCVMATLPCDGANPCSKCIQRKSPCTYVKFQRQTAPVGPGHRHTHSVESTSSASSNLSIPRPDELFLGPPPMTVPSMGPSDGLYYPAHSQFPFNAPAGMPSWENSPNNPPSLTLSSSAADSGHDSSSSDIAVRYRNAEMLRSTMVPPGYSGNSALLPNYYGNQPSGNQPSGGGGPGEQWSLPAQYPSRRDKDMQEGFAQYLPAGTSSQLAGPGSLLHPSNFEFQGGGLYNLHTRRGSVDGYSDGGSAASGPNSATSSSAHLPLDFPQGEQQPQQPQQPPPLDFSTYNQFDDAQRPPPSREGRFASSFGLMSLADGDGNYSGNFNNAEGSAPFFSQSAMKMPPQESTPRPFRTDEELNQAVQATGSVRDREAEMRELREFWKQYLRTPLSGPSLGQTPKAELINNQFGVFGDSRPTPKRGLSRVASLPSVRTPPDEKPSPLHNSRLNQSYVPPTPGNGARPIHTNDDLKSYEQAVLARKAPLNLSLAPKKGRLSNDSSVSPSGSPAMSQQQAIQSGQSRQPGRFVEPGLDNIPGMKAGGLSSLDVGANDQAPQSMEMRPSFKRLPSQTLENTIQKRTLFSWDAAANEDAVDDSESDADGPMNGKPVNRRYGHVESSSPDRYRRLSAPTTTMRPGNSELSPPSDQNRFTSYASNMNTHHANGVSSLSGPGPGVQVDPMVRS